MNVDQIYQLQRDDAFAEQFSADQYQTFVAMPFSNRGGYPERRIHDLLKQVHECANQKLLPETKRRFAPLQRVDERLSGTVTITDEIIRQILKYPFFWGDLTGSNFGVVLETGLALALKPNERVLLFTQDETHKLHFDLAVTRISSYTEENLIQNSARDLARAAEYFELEADRYIRSLSSQLTPDAILLLNAYGRLWKERRPGPETPSLFYDNFVELVPVFKTPDGRIAFQEALRELLTRRLMWTQYSPNALPGADAYGSHATKLGWRVIEFLWQHDPLMRQSTDAPTGPTLA